MTKSKSVKSPILQIIIETPDEIVYLTQTQMETTILNRPPTLPDIETILFDIQNTYPSYTEAVDGFNQILRSMIRHTPFSNIFIEAIVSRFNESTHIKFEHIEYLMTDFNYNLLIKLKHRAEPSILGFNYFIKLLYEIKYF